MYCFYFLHFIAVMSLWNLNIHMFKQVSVEFICIHVLFSGNSVMGVAMTF